MQKISEELKELRKVMKLKPHEMAFVLGMEPQMYRLYERKKFDHTYSPKREALRIQLILLHRQFPKRMKKLKDAKRLLMQFRKNGDAKQSTKPSTKHQHKRVKSS
jgi:transcriptional regulator with XRE-family HTH domain